MRIAMDEGLLKVCTGRDFIDLPTPMKIGFLMCTTRQDIGTEETYFARCLFNQDASLLPAMLAMFSNRKFLISWKKKNTTKTKLE
jgi:hypothetical protein